MSRKIGDLAEAQACKYLKKKRFKILEQNYYEDKLEHTSVLISSKINHNLHLNSKSTDLLCILYRIHPY